MRPRYRRPIPAATAPVGGSPRHKYSSVYVVLLKNPNKQKVQLSGAAQHSFRGAPPSGRGAQEVEIGGGRLVDLGTMQQAKCGNRARCRAVRREAPATAPGAGAPAATVTQSAQRSGTLLRGVASFALAAAGGGATSSLRGRLLPLVTAAAGASASTAARYLARVAAQSRLPSPRRATLSVALPLDRGTQDRGLRLPD